MDIFRYCAKLLLLELTKDFITQQANQMPFRDDDFVDYAKLISGILSAESKRMEQLRRMDRELHSRRARALYALQLTSAATETQIKSSFRSLVKKYHPDTNKGKDATEQYTQVVAAYKHLTS